MNKRDGIEILIKNPISVLKDGLRAQKENFRRRKVKSKYNIEQLPTIDILELFPGFKENLSTYSFLTGTALVTDIMLLKSLARTFVNCSYLEIGSWRGESIANVADVAADCTSITLSAEEMRALNFGEDMINIHGVFSNDKKNITTIEHNSRTYDFTKLEKRFDLIFVDGDHSYRAVRDDSKNVFPLRKNDKSVIVWHDYGLNTEDVRHSVLNGILDGIPREKHKNLFHISNTMCALYIEGRQFHTEYTKFPSKPSKNFSIQLTAEEL